MKAKVLIFFFVLIFQGFNFAEKLADLPEVMQPCDFCIFKDRIFIGDKDAIHIYSLQDFKHLKQFGRSGRGPGEFDFYIRLEVLPDKLAVNTMGKLIYFSLDGDFIKEIRIKPEIRNIHPVGENFVGSIYEGPDTQKMNIYDKNLTFMNTLYLGSYGHMTYWHSDAVKNKIRMVKDYVEMQVYKDRIYIGDTRKGFFFEVFDSSGKKLYEVNNKYVPQKIPGDYKKEMIKIKQESPWWDKIKDKAELIFPGYFPAYRDCLFSDDKIYFVTFISSNDKDETIITDLKGNILGKTYVPSNIKIFTIYKDNVYWLVENEDEEMLELYINVNHQIKRR
jgi:hypothetical protein